MIKLRLIAAPSVGDAVATIDGIPIVGWDGHLVSPDELPADVGTKASTITGIGAYWSCQPSGTSGWYVDVSQ